jgi:hypothetical protein
MFILLTKEFNSTKLNKLTIKYNISAPSGVPLGRSSVWTWNKQRKTTKARTKSQLKLFF